MSKLSKLSKSRAVHRSKRCSGVGSMAMNEQKGKLVEGDRMGDK